jgi:starvation-inducible DNA-binding protein
MMRQLLYRRSAGGGRSDRLARKVHLNTLRSEVMKTLKATKAPNLKRLQGALLSTPTDLKAAATKDISGALNGILADVDMFALHLKTKNFHWHMSGPHFRDYHLLLDEQADQFMR